MISQLAIESLGPHRALALDFPPDLRKGTVTITGASQTGKSTLVDAACVAMWGVDRFGKKLDLRQLTTGESEATCTLTLTTGSTLRHTLGKDKDGKRAPALRWFKGKGYSAERAYKTARAYADAVGALVKNQNVLRHILVPKEWVKLADGEGGGRPLRDLLAEILPEGDTAATVKHLLEESGHSWRRGDPLHEADAVEQRKDANSAVDQAQGAVDALLSLQTKAEEAQEVPESDVEAARKVLAANEAWKTYRKATEAHVLAEEAARRAKDAFDGWHARLKGLGERPGEQADAVAGAQSALTVAQNEASGAERKLLRVRGESDAALAAAERLSEEGQPHPELDFTREVDRTKRVLLDLHKADPKVCPTCGCQCGGWGLEAARAAVARAREASDAAVAASAERAAALLATYKLAVSRADSESVRLETELTQAKAGVGLARLGSRDATKAFATASAQNAPAVEWARLRLMLGECPAEPPPPQAAPESPDAMKVTREQWTGAGRVIRQAEQALGAAIQRKVDGERVEKERLENESALSAATAEAGRLDALVIAIRKAPTVVAREQAGALGELGPVALEFDDDGGCQVLVDGLPYRLASDGRKVIACLWFRAGLRRAAKVMWFPMFVDCVQDVGGQEIPTMPGLILLRTTAGPLAVAA